VPDRKLTANTATISTASFQYNSWAYASTVVGPATEHRTRKGRG